jgi:hypothetical protein
MPIETFQSPIEEVKSDENHLVLCYLLRQILVAIKSIEPSTETVTVDNLDVVSASLRNEISKLVKALPDNKDLLKELKALKEAVSKLEMSPTINVEASKVTVPDITIPEINVPIPQVTVNVPDVVVPEINVPQPIVNVEAPIVNVPEVDLSQIIKALELNLNKLRTNSETRPVAVRISDGQNWVKELQQLNKQAAQTTQFMSDVSYIRNAAGQRINPATEESVKTPSTITDGRKTVTTAGTRVQIVTASTVCRSVTVTALEGNTGVICVGGSTIVASLGTRTGIPLNPGDSVVIEIDNLNKIWLDSAVSGEGVSYYYKS